MHRGKFNISIGGVQNSILHYESSKEHITYKWMNCIRATKERVM
jgi:hypothetical protein